MYTDKMFREKDGIGERSGRDLAASFERRGEKGRGKGGAVGAEGGGGSVEKKNARYRRGAMK